MAAATTISTSPPPLHLHPFPHAFPSPPSSPMRPIRLLRRRLTSLAAAAVRQDAAVWTPAPVSTITPASDDASLFHVAVDLSEAADIAASHTAPGQYLQLRVAGCQKPAFLAIASPPAGDSDSFEFLVKKVPGSTAERLCGLRDGDVVELGTVMGKGFPVERISPADAAETVVIFATGSGISAIRSLVEFGFGANQRADVRLYYGARNLQTVAYQDRFKNWESTGVQIIPVLSQPKDSWKGERGYVQHSFLRAKKIVNPSSTGAVLCGHQHMLEKGNAIGGVWVANVAECSGEELGQRGE